MKNALFCLLMFCSIIDFGQDWQIVQTNKTYFYQHSDSTIISNTIHVESVSASASDSTYTLSTTIKWCDTCTVFPIGSVQNGLFHGYAKDFLGYQINYNGVNKTASFDGNLILLNANLSDSWMFNSSNTAVVTNLGDSLLFGNLDSIKTIVLNGLDTLLLSKNNGIIQFPDSTGTGNIHLTGFHEGQNSIGEYLPNFWSTYDFSVGDKFSFENYELILWDEAKYDITIEILEDLSQGTEKKFVYHLLGIDNHAYGVNDISTATYDTYYYNIIDTMTNNFNQNMFENHFSRITLIPHMTLHPTIYNFPFSTTFQLNYHTDSTYQFTFPEIDPIFGYSTKSYLAKDNGDSLFYIDHWTNLDASFSNGFGRIFQYIFDFEYVHSDVLIGAIKDGDTVGTIFDFPQDLGHTELNQHEINVYPNPTNSKLYFDEQLHSVSVYSLAGQLVQSETKFTNTLNVSHLNAGLYILKAQKKNGSTINVKFLKE